MNRKSELLSAGEILKELRYEKSAKQSTKAAFLKYLIKEAYGVDVEIPAIYANYEKPTNEQLSFGFDEPEKAGVLQPIRNFLMLRQ